MPHAIDFTVLELLCSRICHDLISPVTAINNGMELLDDDPGEMLNDIRDLLMNSASEGAGKLQYFRLAYGMGGSPDGEIGIGTMADLGARLDKHSKSTIRWPADRECMLPRLVAKATMNMVLMAMEALPRGGEIVVEAAPAEVTVTATGQGARIEENNLAVLSGEVGLDSLTPRNIQSYFTREVVAAAGGEMAVDAAVDGIVTFSASIHG